MDLGLQKETSVTMPMPMQDYGSIHESSKYRMHLVPPMSIHSPATSLSNGTSVSRGGSAEGDPAGRPPPPSASTTLLNSAQLDANQTIGDPSVAGANAPSSDRTAVSGSKKPVKYKECLKNHAANIGGHALDGCGEFMPSGKEGSLEALKCVACGCHRNFHGREVEGESPIISAACGFCAYSPRPKLHSHDNRRRFVPLQLAALQPSHPPLQLALPAPPTTATGPPPRSLAPIHMQPPLHSPPDMATPDDHSAELACAADSLLHSSGNHNILSAMQAHHQYHHFGSSSKKRFRTKFSSEQKDRMFNFAEKLGWRIQKHDETAVHHFCADVGVKRHVFKVWMHNNKSTFVKKIFPSEGGQYLDNEGSSPATSSGMQS